MTASQRRLSDEWHHSLWQPLRRCPAVCPGIFVRTAHVPLRGAIDYQALSTKHRLMMKGLCAILRRQPVTERTADTQALLDSYGNAVSFIDFDTLAPIEAWLKKG